MKEQLKGGASGHSNEGGNQNDICPEIPVEKWKPKRNCAVEHFGRKWTYVQSKECSDFFGLHKFQTGLELWQYKS